MKDTFAGLVPVVGTIQQAIVATIERIKLDSEQTATFDDVDPTARCTEGVEGPPSTGESRVVQVVAYLLHICQSNDSDVTKINNPIMLYLTPGNAQATDFIQKAHQSLRRFKRYRGYPLRPLMVIRYQASDTEEDIMLLEQARTHHKPEHFDATEAADVNEASVPGKICAKVKSARDRKVVGLRDARVQSTEFALGIRMLEVMGEKNRHGLFDCRHALLKHNDLSVHITDSTWINGYALYRSGHIPRENEKVALTESCTFIF